jgi:hypothetical protein
MLYQSPRVKLRRIDGFHCLPKTSNMTANAQRLPTNSTLQREIGFLPSIKWLAPISVTLRVTELDAAKISTAIHK